MDSRIRTDENQNLNRTALMMEKAMRLGEGVKAKPGMESHREDKSQVLKRHHLSLNLEESRATTFYVPKQKDQAGANIDNDVMDSYAL